MDNRRFHATYHFPEFFIFFAGILLIFFLCLHLSSGKSTNIGDQTVSGITLVDNVEQNQQPYMEDIQQQIQKSRELLNDLQIMRDQTSSKEMRQRFYAPIMKLTKELEHAERLSKQLDVIDPEPWLRNKKEMKAILGNLKAAYDEALPLLHDQTKRGP